MVPAAGKPAVAAAESMCLYLSCSHAMREAGGGPSMSTKFCMAPANTMVLLVKVMLMLWVLMVVLAILLPVVANNKANKTLKRMG